MKIEVKNIVKHFGKTKAVDGISFVLEEGQIYGFIGPNGAGKTTTLKIMATLDMPTSGDVLFDGISIVQNPEKVRPLIGFMPDSLPAHKDITVHDYLDFFARAYSIKNIKREKMLSEIEEFLNLNKLRSKIINDLSKGMKQRVSLARALVHNPKVILMDEPAAGLDPRARIELRELLKILAEQGKLLFMSSHILTELEDICHGTIIIEQGKLLQAGTLEEIRTSNNHKKKTILEIVTIDAVSELLAEILLLPNIINAIEYSPHTLRVEINGEDDECHNLLKALITHKHRIVEYKKIGSGLEELFMNVTRGVVQ